MYCFSDSSVQSVPPLPIVSHSNDCVACSLLLVAIGPVATGMYIYCSVHCFCAVIDLMKCNCCKPGCIWSHL